MHGPCYRQDLCPLPHLKVKPQQYFCTAMTGCLADCYSHLATFSIDDEKSGACQPAALQFSSASTR